MIGDSVSARLRRGPAALALPMLLLALDGLSAGAFNTSTSAGAEPIQTVETELDTLEPLSLELLSQNMFVAAGGTFTMDVDLGELGPEPTPELDPGTGEPTTDSSTTEGDEELDVLVTLYGRVTDPDMLDDRPIEPINRLPARPLSEYAPQSGVLRISMPIRAGQPFDDVERIWVPDAGVYPIVVELRAGSERRAAVRTNLIRLPAPPEPGTETGGDGEGEAQAVAPAIAIALGVFGDLGAGPDEAAALLAEHPELPMTVVVGSAELAAFEADPALANSLRTAVGSRSVVAVGRPLLDPSALAPIGQGAMFRSSLAGVRDAMVGLGFEAEEAIVAVPGRQTTAGAEEVTVLGVNTAIDLISLGEPPADGSRSGVLATSAGPLSMVVADPLWEELLVDAPPAERIQRLLARLALSDPEQPVLLNAAAPAVDRAEVLELLFDALDGGPITVESITDLRPRLAPMVVDPAPAPIEDMSALANPLGSAQGLLTTYETFYVDGPDSPESFRSAVADALAADGDAEARLATIEALGTRLSESLDVISLPENQSVTLAARSAPIPLTIENHSIGTRQVLLTFRSDKIMVAQEGQVITVGPGTSSIDLDVEALSLGVSPLQVSVLSPDGQRVLSTTRFRVRSTAVPGLGLLISGIGLVFLAIWWYVSIRRDKSNHPSRSTPASDRAASDRAASERADPDSAASGGPPPVDRDPALAGDSV